MVKKKTEKEHHAIMIAVYFTKEQKEIIREKAFKKEVSLSAYIRMTLFPKENCHEK